MNSVIRHVFECSLNPLCSSQEYLLLTEKHILNYFDLSPAGLLSKRGGVSCLLLCCISPSFDSTIIIGELSSAALVSKGFQLLNSLDASFVIYFFLLFKCFQWVTALPLQGGQFRPWTHLPQSHAAGICAKCPLAMSGEISKHP